MMIGYAVTPLVRLLLSAAALIAAVSGDARADSAAVVVTAPEATLRDPIRAAAEQTVREIGWTIVAPGEDGTTEVLAARLVECLDQGADCAREAAAQAGADHVVLIEVTESHDAEGEARVELIGRLIDGRSGAVGVTERRYCERCLGADRLAPVVKLLVPALVRGAGTQQSEATALQIRSRPPGARVLVDGVAIGVTDLRHSVYPGTHRVSIDKPGYEVVDRDVAVEKSTTAVVDVTLTLTRSSKPARDVSWFGAWKWVALGSGAAAVAGGGALIAIDGPRVDNGVRQRHERGTMVAGVVTTVTGVALITSGILMWRSDQRVERRMGADAAVVVPTSDGVLFVVAGEF